MVRFEKQGHGASSIYSMLVSRQWSSVPGTILPSTLERSPGTCRASAPSKEARIAYRHRVNGAAYTSNRVLWGSLTDPLSAGIR